MKENSLIDNPIINMLRKELLDVTNCLQFDNNNLLLKATDAVHRALNCYECSLWSININETVDDKLKTVSSTKKSILKNAYSTSLIHRKLVDNCTYVFSQKDAYLHELKKRSYFKSILENAKGGELFYRNTDSEVLLFKHRIPDFVKSAGLKDFIVIPITRRNIKRKGDTKEKTKNEIDDVIALLEISYQSCIIDDDNLWNEIASICRDFFSAAICRYRLIRQHQIVDALMEVHDEQKDFGVEAFFAEVLKLILQDFCACEAASFFMWDNYYNRYNLIATTGIKSNPNPSDVHYYMDEGLTGEIASKSKPIIVESIARDYEYKWCETTTSAVETVLFIPVTRPSNNKEVIGILRLINKKNICNSEFVDYFNDEDVEIMLFASKYLAFAIESFIKEEELGNFITKLYHETATPINAIIKTAYSLIRRRNEPDFLKKYLETYLNNIIDIGQIQSWQAASNLYLSKNRKQQSFETRYNIEDVSFYYILRKSKELIKPIARNEDVKFDSIEIIESDVPDITLLVDKNAFIIVFYNLFSNAIKYHENTPRDEDGLHLGFRVEVSYRITDIALEIRIKDWGIGINKSDKDAIFQVGYRAENAIRENANGFGVGLPVVRQIIADFGGYIEVTQYNKPTVFEIVLPKKLIK